MQFGEKKSVAQMLESLKRTTYTRGELQMQPLPGVDPTRLESYLSPQDFMVRYIYFFIYIHIQFIFRRSNNSVLNY